MALAGVAVSRWAHHHCALVTADTFVIVGLTVCIGQVGAMFTVVGSDASAHMAEEIRDAGEY